MVAVVAVAAGIAVVKSNGILSHRYTGGTARPPATASPVRVPSGTRETRAEAGAVPSSDSDVATLTADFAQLQSGIDATIGLAIAPAGASTSVVTLGQWTVGPAWSTIKVPLVIAALRKYNPPQVTEAMRAAITHSDNAAAESIWEGLGEPVIAAHTVEQVLIEAGDPTTVEARKIRPQFTAFGQTRWSLKDQIRFAAFAACDDRDVPVRALMGQIEQDQRWGLGVIPNAQFKGGWGPAEAGNYLVRQFGFVTNPSSGGRVSVVAVAVQPASGSFADGTAEMTKIGRWLNDHIAMLPAGQCGR